MTHIAIVGAGIIGAALADRLSSLGTAVTVIDRGRPGSATSGTSLGWLNANNKLPRAYHELSVRAVREWERHAGGFGQPRWYVPTGNLTWAVTEQQRDALSRRLQRLRDWDYPVAEITARDAGTLEPALRVPDTAQIALFPSEGFIHGPEAVTALVGRAQAAGARLVRTDGDVVLDTRGTQVAAVRLPDGTAIHADVYVCCAGWRTPDLLGPVGWTVPLVPGAAPGSTAPCLVTRTSGSAPLSRLVHSPGLNLRPVPGGGLHLEAGDVNALVDAHTPQDDLDRHGERLVDRARQLIPSLTVHAARHRLCIRPLPADGHPIVGWIPGLTNAYVAVTHSGITLAPLLARLVAAEILRDDGDEDGLLDPYRPTRFASSTQP